MKDDEINFLFLFSLHSNDSKRHGGRAQRPTEGVTMNVKIFGVGRTFDDYVRCTLCPLGGIAEGRR